jgi:hypothetical protein
VAGQVSRAGRRVEVNIEETIGFYKLPRQHHKHLKSTNMLERLNEEIGRRTHVVRIFPNAESCLRLIRALCVETHENWAKAHRYLNMDYLCELEKEALRNRPEPQSQQHPQPRPFCWWGGRPLLPGIEVPQRGCRCDRRAGGSRPSCRLLTIGLDLANHVFQSTASTLRVRLCCEGGSAGVRCCRSSPSSPPVASA